VEAMGPDSCILIDDMVLPEQSVHWQATQLDLLMMVLLGARQRTELEWKSLLASVGLKAKRIYPYTQSLRDSIIVAVPV
jgi:demethylsterigmatocystin 6-O-methyltransferase